MGIEKELKSMEVIRIDDHVPRLVRASTRHTVYGHQGGIDWITKVTHYHQIRDFKFLFTFIGFWVTLHGPVTGGDAFVDPFHAPELVLRLPLQRHQLTLAHR